MFKFAFVVLNYNSLDETYKCLESILRIKYDNIEIVLIDNASKEQEEFVERFSDIKDTRVHVLLSKKNVGYARGNNIGIHYAINNLNCDFVCVINPDVVVEDVNFVDTILKEFKKEKFAVSGPKIINHLGDNINPLLGYQEGIGYWIYSFLGCLRIYIVKLFNLRRFNIFSKNRTSRDCINNIEYKENTPIDKETHVINEINGEMLSGAYFFSYLF